MIRGVKVAATVIVGLVSVAGSIVAILEYVGVEFHGLLDAFVSSTRVWLPFVSFAFGLLLGAVLGRATGRGSDGREGGGVESGRSLRRRKVDILARSFDGMTRLRKAMVVVALDEGGVSLWSMDADALALCNMGILGMPPIAPRLGAVDFSVQPAVIREIRSHRRKWLGDMGLEEAKSLLAGRYVDGDR